MHQELAVECSPNTFQRIQNDDKYKEKISQQLLQAQNMDFTPNVLVSFTEGVSQETTDMVAVNQAAEMVAVNQPADMVAVNQAAFVETAVECSPNTFRRIQNDEEYKEKVSQEVLQSQNMDFIPNARVSFTEGLNQQATDVEQETGLESQEDSQPFTDAEEKKNVWLEAPTKLLLSLVEDMRPKVGKSFQLKNKTRMWQQIAEKLGEAGYFFTVSQVQGKYRSLERRYKKTKLHNSKTGRDRLTCPYQSELDKVLGDRRGVFPDFTLDNEELEGVARQEAMQMSSSADDMPSTSNASRRPIFKRTKPKTTQERMLEKLDEMAKQKADYHAKVISFLERNEVIEAERNALLKALVEKLDADKNG